jgi:poly-gamma-glutamate synthesis protein (capsule biosynthesis protein)
MIHWGTEKMETPDELQIQHAIDLEKAGCDLIIGGHPHVLQTISWYEDMPIVYSLGNYFFSFDTRDTGVVQVTFDTENKTLQSLRFVPMVQNYSIHTLEGDEKDRLLGYMRSLSPKVEIDDDGYVTKRETE